MNKPIDLEATGFKRDLSTLGETLIIERLTDPTGGYGMERRFAKSGEGWRLIYYQGLNPM